MARRAVAADPEALRLARIRLARRAGWAALFGLWVFLVVALGSFDAEDWPSHAVAVHNRPTRNLCGSVGAGIAYHTYHVIGLGAWAMLAGVGGFLGLTAARRSVGHPLLRGTGLLLAAVSLSGLLGLLGSEEPAPGNAGSGLLAWAVVNELGWRFSGVGTFLLLAAGFAVGSVVAADQVVAAIPRLALASAAMLRRTWGAAGQLVARPEPRKPREAVDETDEDDASVEAEAEDAEEEEDTDEDAEAEDSQGENAAADAGRDKGRKPRHKLSSRELRAKIAKLPVRMSGSSKDVARDEDIPRKNVFEGYRFPPLELLEDPETNYSQKMESLVRKQAGQLEDALSTYGIGGEVVAIESGPTVTLYSVQLERGTKVAKVQAVASDIARSLRAQNIRVVSNMVGKTSVGIEVPNLCKERVRLKELMTGGHAEGMVLPMFLGKDASGEPLVADLSRMPHMLIAGTTGSGKSVCMNTILVSWLYTKRPDELKLVLVDPKMVELNQFQDVPHLMCPVVTESAKAVAILEWAVDRMEERYELLREAGARNIAAYNRLTEDELRERFNPWGEEEQARVPRNLPYLVFLVDELADLIMTHTEVESSIVRIAQKSRAVGIHLIFATQRPQANVVTGLIKSNLPCRVSFKVASGMDSRIVLDQKGAELLLGQGDMLFLSPHTTEVKRAQGTLVTDEEIRKVTKFLREVAQPTFEPALLKLRPEAGEAVAAGERDPLFDEAVRVMIETGRGSVSLIQRRLGIGYSRASRLVDQMALAGILGDHKGSVAREVLITLDEWEQMKAMEEAAEASGTMFAEGSEGGGDDHEDDADVPIVETEPSAARSAKRA